MEFIVPPLPFPPPLFPFPLWSSFSVLFFPPSPSANGLVMRTILFPPFFSLLVPFLRFFFSRFFPFFFQLGRGRDWRVVTSFFSFLFLPHSFSPSRIFLFSFFHFFPWWKKRWTIPLTFSFSFLPLLFWSLPPPFFSHMWKWRRCPLLLPLFCRFFLAPPSYFFHSRYWKRRRSSFGPLLFPLFSPCFPVKCGE